MLWIWKWYSVVLRYDLPFKYHRDIYIWHNSPLHTKSLYYWKGVPFFSYDKESKIQAITTSLDHRIVVVQWDLSRGNKSVVDGMVAFTSQDHFWSCSLWARTHLPAGEAEAPGFGAVRRNCPGVSYTHLFMSQWYNSKDSERQKHVYCFLELARWDRSII